MAKGRRGRKPKPESMLAVRIRQRLECAPARLAAVHPPVVSISDLERHLNLPTDALRDICRGRTGRNKVHKLGILAKVASVLEFPLDDLAALAGITTLAGKKIDFGTPEVIDMRSRLSKGGDPRLCGTALGVLRAHGEVVGQLGISESMYNAGERFGRLASMVISECKSPLTPLAKAVYEGEPPPPPPTEARISYCDAAYRGAWNALMRADVAARDAIILIGRPSAEVWQVVIANKLPSFADFDLQIEAIPDLGPDEIAARIVRERAWLIGGWLSLRVGLRALSSYFRSPAHADLWRSYRDEDELERLGFDPVAAPLVEEANRRLTASGIIVT